MDNYELDDHFADPIEAYCVRCRMTVYMENPEAVWTRRGMPATRGECSSCGGVVFRMGKTDAHREMSRPAAVKVATNTRAKLPQETVYVNFAAPDEAIAEQIAADLQKVGIASWLHELEPDQVNWAGGVHPALKECSRMVLVLSPAALTVPSVEAAWQFFKGKNKPIVMAQVTPTEPPDPIRRKPRFDFTTDYKSAFRQMVQVLSE